MTDKEQIIELSLDLISCFLHLGEQFKLSDKDVTYTFHRPISDFYNLRKSQLSVSYPDKPTTIEEFDLYNQSGFYWLRLHDTLLKIGSPITIETLKSFGDKVTVEYSDGHTAQLVRLVTQTT